MTAGMVSLYALAALLGLAPAVLRASLSRAGIGLSADSQASESDLARVFGPKATREFIQRAKGRPGRRRMKTQGSKKF
jgi:hypothetical protein